MGDAPGRAHERRRRQRGRRPSGCS
uniref:Uncharacterized protein n=1 Tax=Arundo donax TaxID=35708 RepID=A0A0A9GKW3_ARUDO